MTFIPHVAVTLVVTGAACTAALAPKAPDQSLASRPAPVTCDLQITRRGQMSELTAQVQADRPVSGHYRLEIQQDSATGRADIRQAGDFALSGKTPETLFSARLSAPQRQIRALLSVEDSDNQPLCTSTLPTSKR